LKFKVLLKNDCEQVRAWRNEILEALRTPFPLTEEQQGQFYQDVICNRDARARFWGIWVEEGTYKKYPGNIIGSDPDDSYRETFIGMAGLENIEYENGRAEISIILNPVYQGKGYGKEAFDILLRKGFNELGLRQIWGEYYDSNPAKEFWQKIIKKYNGYQVRHKCIKFWNGEYWDSTYFSFEWKDYLKVKKGRGDLNERD